MTVIGVDDTDSRERGMCTTYLASQLADRLRQRSRVERTLLVRLNPAVPYKTRGNAALAIHTDLGSESAFDLAYELIDEFAETADEHTDPGLVVAPGSAESVDPRVSEFARTAVIDFHDLDSTLSLADATGLRHAGWKSGRGRIGALAAIGAWTAFDDWTVEHIAYRAPDRWGTPREVDVDSVFAAADRAYPAAWDTVDHGESDPVCVPHTPGPVLYGIRGDDLEAVRQVAGGIDSEPAETAELFLANQGTDAHLQPGEIGGLAEGRAYRVTGSVTDPPATRRGGHVFLRIENGSRRLECAAFEPTKRFRDRVRALRAGDRVTVCGEVSEATLKLEKFAVRSLVTTERTTPTCSGCGRRMESAGADQGYRCRDCDTTAPGKVKRPIDRDLERGWYEVPPCARRHIAKPLVRGGFDAPVHPER